MPAGRRQLPLAWAAVLAVLLLGPALGVGYVLSYDMVWVPDLALRPDLLGLGSGLPRAVPSDAVIAVLDAVVPGMLLQKVVLLGSLVAAGTGVARLVPAGPSATLARLVAVSLTVWSPFVAERLLLGHWPVLVGYAVLPWLVAVARRWRERGALPPALLVLLPLGSLSVSAGLATAVALVAFAATRDVRRWLVLVGLLVAANAPWLVAGLLHAGSATTTRAGVEVFGLHPEGSVPAPLAALTLGGIWNSEVVPASRTGFQGWLVLLVVLALVLLGLRPWWERWAARDRVGLLVCWVVGTSVAVLTWLAPGPVGAVAAAVPGAGVLRDGSRALALAAPALALIAAEGARVVAGRMTGPGVLRGVVGTTLVIFPLALMPDAAWGSGGRLTTSAYPADYAAARAALARAHDRAGGDVLLLPFSSYRQPGWSGDRKVLDPVGRYLTPDHVAQDELVVGGVVIAGEDPRARQAARALARPDAAARAAALADLGIGYVVRERDAAGEQPAVRGTVVHDGPVLQVLALDGVTERRSPGGWRAALALAWVAFLAGPVVALGVGARTAARGRGRKKLSQ